MRQPYPVAQQSALDKSAGSEKGEAGRVAGGNVGIQLVQVQKVQGIFYEGIEGVAAEAPAGISGVDEYADCGFAVGGVVVEAVDRSYGFGVAFGGDDEPQLVVPGNVGGIVLDILFEQEAGERGDGIAVYPQRGVVFPAVECLEVFGFDRPQFDLLADEVIHGRVWISLGETITRDSGL